MNLVNYEVTGMGDAYLAVRREAGALGVEIESTEIVGLVPSAALLSAAEYYLQIEGFKTEQVLENKLRLTEV